MQRHGVLERQGPRVTQQLVAHNGFDTGAQAGVASFSSQAVGFDTQGQADVCFDLTMQVSPARRRVDQAPEMGEVERRRGKAEQPVERGVHGLGLELDRRRGREHELPRAVVKFAIADAKVVAGEDAAAAAIDHGDVVTGVARRIQAEQFAPGQDRDETVVRLDDTRGIDRNDLAIKAPGGFNTVTACVPAISFDGSIMCRAPRGCTRSLAAGKACIIAPAPPAWSRCTWVRMTQSTASTVRPKRASVARTVGKAWLVPVSTTATRPDSTIRWMATNCGRMYTASTA